MSPLAGAVHELSALPNKSTIVSHTCLQDLLEGAAVPQVPAEAQASCSVPFVPALGPLNIGVFWSQNIPTTSQKTF